MNYKQLHDKIIYHYQSLYGQHEYGKQRPFNGAEHHHIIHRHEGGSNEPTNLVWLPFKAHRLVHKLSSKIDKASRWKRHSYLMMYGLSEIAKAEQLAYARSKSSFQTSSRFTGKTQSDYQKQRASETHRNKIVSPEARAKMAAAKRGKIPWNKQL